MNLDRREVQFLHDRRVLDSKRIIHRASLEPFGCEARACDGRAAAEGLELRVLDDLRIGIDLDLKLHHIAAFGRADKPGTDAGIFLVEASDISGIVVVVNDLI